MAKKRKAGKPAAAKQHEEADADPFAGPSESTTEEQAAPKSGPSFFRSLGDGLKAAGQTAERYARMGAGAAELEKLRFDLKMAYSRLGETIIKCWDAAPDIGVAANDPAVKDPVTKVKDLRRKIREIEIKIKTLQAKP